MGVEPGAEFADFGFELSHPSRQRPHEFGQFHTWRAARGGQRQRVAHASMIGRWLALDMAGQGLGKPAEERSIL